MTQFFKSIIQTNLPTMVELVNYDMSSQADGSAITLSGYHSAGDQGGGTFVYDATEPRTSHNGGTIIDPAAVFPTDWTNQTQLDAWFNSSNTGTGCWKRVWDKSYVTPDMFGAKANNLTVNTVSYSALISACPENTKIIFNGDKTYIGNFVSQKSLNVDFRDALLKPDPTDHLTAPIYFYGSRSLITTLSTDASYGDISISVADASQISSGDLLQLVDGKVRPSDSTPEINTELIKVKSVSGTTVYVEDIVRSEQDTGTRNVYLLSTLENINVENVNLTMVDSTAPGVYFQYCSNVITKNIKNTDFVGNALRFESCYNFSAKETFPTSPRLVTSGQGYGIAAYRSRCGIIENVFAEGTRHPVDYNTVYDVHSKSIFDPSGNSGGLLGLAHNTFGGLVSFEDVWVTNDGYAVDLSSQGVSTPADFIAHDITVKNINHVIPSLKTNEFNYSVYIQTAYDNLNIDKVNVRYIDTTATPTGDSGVVRLNGMANGHVSINNISANEVGCLVFVSINSFSAPYTDDVLNINNLSSGRCFVPVYLRGERICSVDNLSCPTIDGTAAIVSTKSGSYYLDSLFVENSIFTDSSKLVLDLSGNVVLYAKGKFHPLCRDINSITKNTGDIITPLEVQQKGRFLNLQPPTAADITLNATGTIALPSVIGQEIKIVLASSRGSVIIPAASDSVHTDGATDITLTKGRLWSLVGGTNKWYVQGV